MVLSNEEVDVKAVLKQEEQLQFLKFTHADALELVREIVTTVATHYEKPVTIHIEYGGTVVAHYLMDGRIDSDWVDRKKKTVMEIGHSSLLAWLQRESEPSYQLWEKDASYAICGGGFPIYENGVTKGCIIVSGLEHREDHKVIVAALRKLLNK